jgi:sugar diacid utilization regulator
MTDMDQRDDRDDRDGPDKKPQRHAERSDAALHYLELLAHGAPATAYQELPSAGEPAGTAQARRLALRVRAELEGRRRREAELTALFETAHDLAGLRDLDAVLRAIVQRARSLLSTEVAYLTLTDPERGDTYMRVTEGSVSARFQQLRLNMGEGLGGLVAQTARPYVTDDYMGDDRFRHTRTIDTGVSEEGLVAILGVPLLLGRAVIGVLYAADRRARVFEREEIALLGSFAAHAAVAIDTARLLAETRGALAELESANAIARDHARVIERAGDIHDRLTELVLRGGGVSDVVAVVAEVLDAKVEFTESTPPAAAADGRAVRSGERWVAPVAAGGELLGALLVHGLPELDPVDRRTLERAAMVTSLLLLARRTAGEAEQRVRGELLDDLLDAPDRDPRLLRERAARLGAALDLPHTVLAARVAGPAGDNGADRQRLWSAASHLAVTGHGLASARDGCTVLLLPTAGQSTTALAQQTSAQLSAALSAPVTVGAAAPADPPADRPAAVAAAFAEARRCLEALRLLGREGDGTAADDLGFLGLLLSGSRDIDGFITRTIGPVLDYDTRRSTELLATLDTYFQCGMSASRAKDALHIHVNTVSQRLDRIARLLGADWQSPDRTLEIQLALRLHHLAAATG